MREPATSPSTSAAISAPAAIGLSGHRPDALCRPTAYHAVDGAIVGHGQGRYGNRPLYANSRNDVVLGGDRPLLRVGRAPLLFGTLLIGVVRGGSGVARWLHDCSALTVAYRPGRLTWTIADAGLPGLALTLDAVPTVGDSGLAVRLVSTGTQAGDRVVWAFGGCLAGCNPNHDFDPVVLGEAVTATGFVAEHCRDNLLTITGETFRLGHTAVGSAGASGTCSAPSRLTRADANQARDPLALLASTGTELPLLCAETPLVDGDLHWVFRGLIAEQVPPTTTPAEAFAAGCARGADLEARVRLRTPEPRLDALAAASTAAIDGLWYPPFFAHSAMLWNMPYLGWRTMYGATMYGWHERVRAAARAYLASQVRASDKTRPEADPGRRLALQGEGSRFYGAGRITLHAGMYDMQSQFFDQLISAWRATADAELEALLRPALELHLDWLRECFDPDDDGLYESYINTWPTDSVWYNGGGSAEATSYAHRGHQAALDLARRAGDAAAEARHRDRLERIRTGFHQRLWVTAKGHPGKCREQVGHQRLHEDPWAYSLFLPIDAGLLDQGQAASTLHYALHTLQNERKPYGGRMTWYSNWVPGIWSVRYDWPADCYHLALAFFQSGLADDGWDLLLGTFLSSGFELAGLGNLGHKAGGTDFGDCSNTFARTLVEGLFGYRPDHPNGTVVVAPGFPRTWDHAEIALPDCTLRWRADGTTQELAITLARPAALRVILPVRARRVTAVTADGQPVPYTTAPGFDQTLVEIALSTRGAATIAITIDAVLPATPVAQRSGTVGNAFTLTLDGDPTSGELLAVDDPQGALRDPVLRDGRLAATIAANPGHHLLLATVRTGDLTQRRLVPLLIDDPAGEARRVAAEIDHAPAGARWRHLDLRQHLNADVRTIFQQRYLSPRPDTVSLRIGDDGWSPWTAPFWNLQPPRITLDRLDQLGPDEPLIAPDGATFAVARGSRNIAFTSLWDNLPTAIEVPCAGATGEALWLLVAGSTNPMQCRIANAVIRLRYRDGVEDAFDLVPPRNFWALAPLAISGSCPGQEGRADYDHPIDAFCVPQPHPPHVWLGENCRAMVYGRRLRPGVPLLRVELETLSAEVVIGLMAVSVMNPG